MTNAPSTPRSPVNESAQGNELADIVSLRLHYCSSESRPTSYCPFSREKGMFVEQIMAAAKTGSFLHHHEIHPKPAPMEFNA